MRQIITLTIAVCLGSLAAALLLSHISQVLLAAQNIWNLVAAGLPTVGKIFSTAVFLFFAYLLIPDPNYTDHGGYK